VKQHQCESEYFIQNNDRVQRFAKDFYIKLKEGEREQDSVETERECVFVREREAEHCGKRKIVSIIKQTIRE
jgi:hypothetical protein